MQYLIISIASYLFGAIPFGFIIGKIYGKDIRLEGSGNIGATNVTRVIGKKAGKLCFFLDFLKGAIPVILVDRFYPELSGYGLIIAGSLAVIGHMFPIYLNFKGGKGISTAGGVAVGMLWQAFVIALLTWIMVFLISRYVSLASIIAAALLPIIAVVISISGYQHVPLEIIIFFTIIAIVAIWKHRSNITRLRNGTELRFSKKREE